MTEYIKIGKEDFEIVDWVTTKENPNDFIMQFRTKGNVQAARTMVNKRLQGIIGKYSIVDEVEAVCQPPDVPSVSNTAEAAMDKKLRQRKPMPGSTSEL